MVFPDSPLGARSEFQIGGVWTDVTQHALSQSIITHTRGRTAEGQAVDPASCSLLLKSPAGLYSPRNPRSPYYQLIGRNTPMRVSIQAARRLVVSGSAGSRATTPDNAALDITGDIDIRVDAALDNWGRDLLEIAAKQDAVTDQRSWRLVQLGTGICELVWFTAGTAASGVSARSTVPLPALAGQRTALRVTVDVNNGAGGWTATWYTAPTLAGPWTQLGAQVTGTGVTSIFNSNAPLEIGDVAGMTIVPAAGAYYGLEVRNGINGTVVASPDFTALANGTTSFTDGAGRSWSVQGDAEVTDRWVRFCGEFSDWPPDWSANGDLIKVDGEGSGVLRRLQQGSSPLDSTLRRRIPSGNPIAYWPMEEESGATRAYSPLAGVRPMTLTGVDWSSDGTLGGSQALPVVQPGATMSATVPAPASGTGPWQVEMVYRIPTAPGALATVYEIAATGTGARYTLQVQTNNVQFKAFDADGTQLLFFNLTAGTTPNFFGGWNRVRVFASQNGGNVDVTLGWLNVSSPVGHFQNGSFAGTVGRVSKVSSAFGAGLDGMALGHLAVFQASDTKIFDGADDGFLGETATARVLRLAAEEGLPIAVAGIGTESMQMGPQRPATLLEILADCEAADGGILTEDRTRAGLRYRTRTSLYNQAPALTLAYGTPNLARPLEPVDEADYVRNSITVTRTGGSSASAELEDGPLSTQAPPNGVGLYEDSVDLNLYSDAQTEPVAGWRLHLGTWDEARYPTVRVRLHKAPELIPAVLALYEGDVIRITDLPDWLPPGPVDLIVQGYTERLGIYTWEIDFVCVPAGPWRVAVYDTDRYDTSSSQLTTAATSTGTALTAITTDGPRWTTDAGDLPFTVTVGGETMSVTAASSWLSDTFTRTVANGWGTPDTGSAWNTVGGGPSSDYSVGSGLGAQVLSTLDVSRRTAVTAVHGDFDIYCDITTSALATGDSLYGAVTARMLDASNMYLARLEFTTGNAVILSVRKIIADVQTQLGAFTLPVTHVAGTFIRVRFQGKGTLLQAKAWLASAAEPARWHVSATDSAITAANQIGTRSIRSTGNTNPGTVAIRYDNFTTVNPQIFTVSRSQNGIVKAQSAGTAVSLAQPAIRAL